MQLYKGRYLIAIYDVNDRLIEVSNSINTFWGFTEVQIVSMVRKDRRDIQHHSYFRAYLIDCLEEHDDCFAEEDKIFLEEEPKIEKYLKTLPKPIQPKGASNAHKQERAKILGQTYLEWQRRRKQSLRAQKKKLLRRLQNANPRATEDDRRKSVDSQPSP